MDTEDDGSDWHEGCALPAVRSFVVRFSPDTTTARRCFRGRVEHIEPGRPRRFASTDEADR